MTQTLVEKLERRRPKGTFTFPENIGYAEGYNDAFDIVRQNEAAQPPSPAIHAWKDHPGVTTTPVKCLLCDSEAAVIVYAPNGCTCSPNKYQPRCEQHLRRAWDTGEDIVVVEDFRLPVVEGRAE
jgi:hypothetical protein